MRKAGQYIVNVYENQFLKLQGAGVIDVVDENINVLTDMSIYDIHKGLIVNIDDGVGVFFWLLKTNRDGGTRLYLLYYKSKSTIFLSTWEFHDICIISEKKNICKTIVVSLTKDRLRYITKINQQWNI